MTNAAVIARLRFGAIALIVALTLSSAPIAHAHGGGGGGGHGGGGFGGGHGGGYGGGHGGGYGGGHGGRGGYGGHRGFGGHGFGYGRFGYGGFGFYDGFGLLGYGLFFDALPLYYSTYWWGGVPYYYANDNFYQWDGSVGQYQTVRAPQGLASQVATQGSENLNLFAYPKNGQTTEQQATDRVECQQWATGQTGIDSAPAGSTAAITLPAAKRQDYLRAQAACLQGRGYSVQ
jgi:hypothetical protein